MRGIVDDDHIEFAPRTEGIVVNAAAYLDGVAWVDVVVEGEGVVAGAWGPVGATRDDAVPDAGTVVVAGLAVDCRLPSPLKLLVIDSRITGGVESLLAMLFSFAE